MLAKMKWKSKKELRKRELEEEERRKSVKEREKQEKALKEFVQFELNRRISADELSEEEQRRFLDLYNPFEVGVHYDYDERVRYDGKVYRVRQPHISQADWIPPNVPALFELVLQKETEEGEEVIHDWEQPVSGPNALPPYQEGDKVRFNGNVYKSIINNNVWSPTDYPQGWERVE